MNKAKYPEVTIRLVGEDGNVFSLISRVARALRQSGHADAEVQFEREAFAANSYDEVLRLAISYVKVL